MFDRNMVRSTEMLCLTEIGYVQQKYCTFDKNMECSTGMLCSTEVWYV